MSAVAATDGGISTNSPSTRSQPNDFIVSPVKDKVKQFSLDSTVPKVPLPGISSRKPSVSSKASVSDVFKSHLDIMLKKGARYSSLLKNTRSTVEDDSSNDEDESCENNENIFVKKNMKPSRIVDSDDQFDMLFRLYEGHFLKMGGKTGAIRDIDVVKNARLETVFLKKQIEFKNEKIPHKSIFAYHGTKASVIDSILKDNFDITKAKRQLHGAGNYFSEYPNTALGYSDDAKHLIFCKILPGRQYKGTAMSWPDHESKLVLPNSEDYSEMVIIQDKDQILPICVLNFY